MKRIIISMAVVLAIILMTLSLQGCFTPWPEGVHRVPDRDRDIWLDMQKPWP